MRCCSLMVVLVAACGVDLVEVEDSRREEVAQDRIVGGVGFSGLPAVGAITYYGSQHCTGTLIGPRTVLTAAHCVQGYPSSAMRFVIGPNLGQAEAVLRVASSRAHPDYNSYALTNDIGIITLTANAPVAPLPVLDHMDASWVGSDLFFVGYGVSDGYSGTGAGIKRAVWMRVSHVGPGTFRYDDPNKNTCSGDSGGPAFFRDSAGAYYVAGVTSYGDAYCTDYGVDTRVDAYRAFLGISPPQTGCQGETYEGRCEGGSVIWCENDQINTNDCAAMGRVCLYDTANDYYACREDASQQQQEPVDPCNGETWEGRCDGNTVIWCEGGEVKSLNCNSCGWDGGNGYYNCM